MIRQGLLLHALAGIQSRLLTIAGQGADQGGLAPADAQLQHQAVEAVALGAARPDGDEGGLEGLLDVAEHQMLAGFVAQHELVDPDRLAGRRHLEALFDQRLQAHVLQDRQHIGQRGSGARAIELEAERHRAVARAAEGADADGLALGQVVDDRDVGQGLIGVVLVAIAGREGAGVASQQVRDAAGGTFADDRFEAVVPGAGSFGDGGLDGGHVRLGVIARRHAQDVVDTGQRRVREAGIVCRHPAPERVGQDLAGPGADARVIAVARHEHQHRDEAVERVAAGEDLHARPVVEVQHAQRGAQQLGLVALEQLVARPGLEDVAQALAVVAVRILAGRTQHMGDLAADQRHFVRGGLVGLGGEQAHEADLARGLAVGAVPAHADIIHVAAAMDARAQVGLGHHDRVADVDVRADLGRQDGRLAASAQDGAGLVAQDAQAAFRLVQRLLGRIAAIGGAGIFIDAGAQEHEVVALQPVEEVEILGLLLGRHRRRRGLQFGDRTAHQGAHGLEVLHGVADVGQRFADARRQGRFAVLADRGQPDLDHRAAHAATVGHGVEHGPDREAGLGHLAHDAVDQERTVGLDDLEQVGGGLAAFGATHADDGFGDVLGVFAETPEFGQGAGDVGDVQARQLLGRPVVLRLGGKAARSGRQGLDRHAQGLGEGGYQRADRDLIRLEVVFFTDHRISSRIFGRNLALLSVTSTATGQIGKNSCWHRPKSAGKRKRRRLGGSRRREPARGIAGVIR